MTSIGAIIHVVLVEWKSDAPAEARAEAEERARRFLNEMDGVLTVTCGPSVSVEGLEAGFEWGLVITFADAAARDAYLPHPSHQPVADLIGRWSERLVVFDLAA